MSDFVLLSTVGGSHQPIIEAIRSLAPGYVCFFCTEDNRQTGERESLSQVTGSGNVINANPNDDRPTLPNIPTQAGLADNRFEVHIVPSDDLDGSYVMMRETVVGLSTRFPGARFVADYTGGTKTMTAALVCAALQSDDVELQLVSGARRDLVGVVDGTEQAMTASAARLRLERAMAPYLAAWKRYAYQEAAAGLERIRVVADAPDRQRLNLALVLSRALARWDDFDHSGALRLLEPYAGSVTRSYPSMLPTLRLLSQESDPKREPARLIDLWLNARRRASQGRFDDAVARVYRLIEWTAQWLICTKLGADTGDFPDRLLPEDVDARRDGRRRIKLPLWAGWQVVSAHVQGPPHDLIASHGNELRDLLSIRNNSILAHGFAPVAHASWNRMQQWAQDQFLPVLHHYAKDARVKESFHQLPTDPP